MSDLTMKNSLNYEAEYECMKELNYKLSEENAVLRKDLDSLETEFSRMRAQLDIVYLIFGGKA